MFLIIGVIDLVKELPNGYEEACFEEKAIQRKRGIANPNNLMMLSILHLLNGCSLVEISTIAKLAKLGDISDVAFMKRFEACNDWFLWNTERLMTDGVIKYQKPSWVEEYRVMAMDASDVSEKGRSGRIFRLHFALELFRLRCEEYQITTQKTGESLRNFTLKAGDLIIADRIYSTFVGMKHCLENQANFVMRLRSKAFIMYDYQGQKINLLAHLEKLKDEESLDMQVYVGLYSNEKRTPLRICAIRKDAESINKSHRRFTRKKSKKQEVISEETITFNDYIVVVTALPDSISAQQILELYRWRWQVELYFKRLKSIMDFGDLPKKRSGSVFAWLNGKMMIAILIEKIIGKTSFPPKDKYATEYMA